MSQERTWVFDESILPSTYYTKNLYKKTSTETLSEHIERPIYYQQVLTKIDGLNSSFNQRYKEIEEECIQREDEITCCRDINYHFDIVKGIIKSFKLEESKKNDLITKVEDNLKQRLSEYGAHICERKEDLDSIRKRCIIKQLHDFVQDKEIIQNYSKDYNTYLVKKWNEIIKYTDGNDDVYIKIENDFMGILDKYKHFLEISLYIPDVNLESLKEEDIKISTDLSSLITSISLDTFPSERSPGKHYNELYKQVLSDKVSNIQTKNILLPFGVTISGVSLILLLLHKFSPLGNLLRRYTKMKVEEHQNMSDELPELYENSEIEEQYISYHSAPH
ncbi:PIR Superfamily Protein [Plasmodium ovale wallikeri]|uniref:PIR Superfamily Protein n=1 Tax=Plasmodium ovale wallikeri TaxID=864142 RepID=A0A1A9AHP9_PLAOA|nr:PIR Superfamily Protein [Plasmodium ovale wallikeri]